MEHFVRIVMEKQEGVKLDESVFPTRDIFETDQGGTAIEIPLPRELSEDESNEFAQRLADMMFENGYDDFDIEISTGEEMDLDEETYDGDEFFEQYGVMWYNEDEDLDEAYIKTRKDAVETLGRLRGIGKKIETGRDTYDGNLANEYVSDVYDVINWLDANLGISGMNDPKLKQVLEPVVELRKEAKGLETKPDSGKNARFGNKIVNTLYPLMVYIEDHMEEPKKESMVDEAEYQGRKVKLGKPMRGDVKKFKVYVKDPKTKNVKKVNFGDPNMKIKKSNPARRRSFRARHNCDNPGPRTKARYWSCRKW